MTAMTAMTHLLPCTTMARAPWTKLPPPWPCATFAENLRQQRGSRDIRR
jgi:hypothetical protein